MSTIEISPSILSADFSALKDEIVNLEKAGADRIHLDVMDGHFVPNITFGANVIKSIRPLTKIPFETHLMINPNEGYIKNFIEAGSDIILIHPESTNNWKKLIKIIKNSNIKAGIVLNPNSNIKYLSQVIDIIDQVLIMTVHPGFCGQQFIQSQLQTIKNVKQLISNKNIDLAVDGGINKDTAKECIKAGANILIAGSFIFQNSNYKINIDKLRI